MKSRMNPDIQTVEDHKFLEGKVFLDFQTEIYKSDVSQFFFGTTIWEFNKIPIRVDYILAIPSKNVLQQYSPRNGEQVHIPDFKKGNLLFGGWHTWTTEPSIPILVITNLRWSGSQAARKRCRRMM